MSHAAPAGNNIRETQREAYREREDIIKRSFPDMKKWYKQSGFLEEKFGKFPMFWQDFLTWEHERVIMKAYFNHLEGMDDEAAVNASRKKTNEQTETPPDVPASSAGSKSEEDITVTSTTKSEGTDEKEKEKRRRKRRRWDKDTETDQTEKEVLEATTTTAGTTQTSSAESNGTSTKNAGKKRKKNRWSVDPEVEERKEVEQQIWKLQKLAADTNVGEVLAQGSSAIQEVQDKVNAICGQDGLSGVLEKAQKHGLANNLGLSNLGAVLGDETSASSFSDNQSKEQSEKNSRQRQLEITKELQSLNWKIENVDAIAAAERHNPNRPPSPAPQYDSMGRRTNKLEQRMKQQFMDRKSELTRELVQLNPAMKTLYDQGLLGRKEKVTRKIYIPVDEYPDYNFMGVIIGPRGQTQKQLEAESNCKISVRGRGANKEGKMQPQEGSDDDLHVWIQGDNEQDVEACATLINRLLEPREEDDEWRKQQMKDLAIINGTFRQQDQIIATEVKNMNYDTAADLEKVLQTVGEGAAKREEAIRKGKSLEEVEADENQDADYLRYIEQLTGKAPTTEPASEQISGTAASTTTTSGADSVTASSEGTTADEEATWKLPSLVEQKKQRQQRFQQAAKGSDQVTAATSAAPPVTTPVSQPIPYVASAGNGHPMAPPSEYTHPSVAQQSNIYPGYSQAMVQSGPMTQSEYGSAPQAAVNAFQHAPTSNASAPIQGYAPQPYQMPFQQSGGSFPFPAQAQGQGVPSSGPQNYNPQAPPAGGSQQLYHAPQPSPYAYQMPMQPYAQSNVPYQGMQPHSNYAPQGYPGYMPNAYQWNPYYSMYMQPNPAPQQQPRQGSGLPSHPAMGLPRHRLYK